MNFSVNRLTNFTFHKIFSKNIIQRYYKKRNVFEQHHYNPYHINSTTFKKKPSKFDFFSDKINWPPEIPPSNPLYGKALLMYLEKQEKDRINSLPVNKKKARVRTGDMIELEYYMSLTNKKINKYKGTVIGTRRINSLTYSFRILMIIDSFTLTWDLLYHSPMIASIKITEPSTLKWPRAKVYHFRRLNKMGTRILELMKGGKNLKLTKKVRKASKAQSLKIRSGVIEEPPVEKFV
jgi:ribosomal protein L19